MTIASLFGTRIATGLGALAIATTLAGSAAAANTSPAEEPAPQSSAVKQMRQDLREQTQPEREAMKELRRELSAEYTKDRPDAAKMKRLHAAIEARKATIADARFDAFVAVHDELTPEQRAEAARKMAKGKKHADSKGKGKGKKHSKGKKHADGKGKGKKRASDKDKDSKRSKRERRPSRD